MRRELALLVLAAMLLGADRPPWPGRRRTGIRPNRAAGLLVSPGDWPAEPVSPPAVDPGRFASAIEALCGWMPRGRSRLYADWMIEAGREFGEDPFLLGALAYRESRCQPRQQALGGVGLTSIAADMYRDGFRSREYLYWVKTTVGWEERKRSLARFPFTSNSLLRAESNLYFAAGLLSVWREQHATVDAEFPQIPHRHYLSHWVWGDRVKSARAEDRVLTDRRRLLQYYGSVALPPPLARGGLQIGSPLDGAPRVISSAMGSPRSDGREHRGVDIESEFGEPVRAAADGRVVFAGVDLPGRRHNEVLAPEEINTFGRSALGRGGRYVCIHHSRPEGGYLRSCYMHLETANVASGAEVSRGQQIGTVGRTGMKSSSPHLHLEIRTPDGVVDPLEYLRGHLLGRPGDAPAHKRRRPAAEESRDR